MLTATWRRYLIKSAVISYGVPLIIVVINVAVTLPLSENPDMPPVCGEGEINLFFIILDIEIEMICWEIIDKALNLAKRQQLFIEVGRVLYW